MGLHGPRLGDDPGAARPGPRAHDPARDDDRDVPRRGHLRRQHGRSDGNSLARGAGGHDGPLRRGRSERPGDTPRCSSPPGPSFGLRYLNGWTLVGGQLPHAAARERVFPVAFAASRPAARRPWRSSSRRADTSLSAPTTRGGSWACSPSDPASTLGSLVPYAFSALAGFLIGSPPIRGVRSSRASPSSTAQAIAARHGRRSSGASCCCWPACRSTGGRAGAATGPKRDARVAL